MRKRRATPLLAAVAACCWVLLASEVRGVPPPSPTPAVHITSPNDGDTLSNVTATIPGSTIVGVTGTATGTFHHWNLDYCCPPPNNTYTIISTGLAGTSVSGDWETLWVPSNQLFPYFVPNGTYTLRLQALDSGGTALATVMITVTFANFSARQSGLHYGLQLNWTANETVTYTSTVPTLPGLSPTETLYINNVNSSGTSGRKRTFQTHNGSGTNMDQWDGKTDPPSDSLLPDGNYYYFATVTAGTYSMTWDVSGRYLNANDAFVDHSPVTISDSFKNVPFRFAYNLFKGQNQDGSLDLPSQVWLIFGPAAPAKDDCGPVQYCVFAGIFQPGGDRTVEWAYVDANGVFRGEAVGILAALRHFILYGRVTHFPLNMAILYGGAPKVTGVTVTPSVFGFGASSQTVSFSLGMPGGDQTSHLTVSFRNQASGSFLRTLTLPNQGANPSVTTSWDGRADNNGPPVAPGFYTVTVTATGPRGEVAIGQILTTVQY